MFFTVLNINRRKGWKYGNFRKHFLPRRLKFALEGIYGRVVTIGVGSLFQYFTIRVEPVQFGKDDRSSQAVLVD